ncbi:methyltransferase [Gammaproteobacteria bacterium]|nr:methyltransferase [Gammaproteobacteria bacterium]MDA9174889.1 methyltransferase [Gammaproteobacteria bacterium]MDA9835310.1 methyltransferase [Gammaproteobacteria bacterium]MDA9869459.1 methyltransferase [Gammaproteobacteria bacterium]MDA9979259.1 methyltransferase [Gammaproteobacteria bacterium]
MKNIFNSAGCISLLLAFSSMTQADHHPDPLLDAIKDPARNSAYAARDDSRNPYKTLSFFKITPSMQVLELAAGGGWYTEILSPYLRDSGSLTVTHYNPESGAYAKRSREGFDKKVASNPLFEGVKIVSMGDPINPQSKDLVLTFRNLHNWLARDTMTATMLEAYNALKPGGYFGVVEHRAPESSSMEYMTTSGYVTQSLAIEVAESVGFTLIETSEINANAKDTKDHPKGVWTLPPSYRLKDENRSKYEAIGESDRMTLLFMK